MVRKFRKIINNFEESQYRIELKKSHFTSFYKNASFLQNLFSGNVNQTERGFRVINGTIQASPMKCWRTIATAMSVGQITVTVGQRRLGN